MNGFFQIQIKEQGVNLLLFPPIGEGEQIRAAELKEYLNKIGVPYDVKAINSALSSLGEEVVLFLAAIKLSPVDAIYNIQVAPDKMSAIMRMYPPSTGGRPASKEQIMDLLSQFRIKAGIDEEAITVAIEESLYCTDIVVARGKMPTVGRDASIVYHLIPTIIFVQN